MRCFSARRGEGAARAIERVFRFAIADDEKAQSHQHDAQIEPERGVADVPFIQQAFSSGLSSVPPLTCAQPVMPGRTISRTEADCG